VIQSEVVVGNIPEGQAGLCTIVDSATFHTRLDGDGQAGRRIIM